jgi:hypothetical protein
MSVCTFGADDEVSPFDKPVKAVLDLGPSPYHQASLHMRKKLTCFVYPTFMVKEYDDGSKGARWISILRFEGNNRPGCSFSHLRGEKVLPWGGYFKGAKDSFAFIDADDGTDGGLPFAVYDTRNGKEVFRDSARMAGNNHVRALFTDFHIERDNEQRLVLRYLRVVSAACDLNKDPSLCWKQVRTRYRIDASQPPACIGYEHDYRGKWPSAVGYQVSVTLDDHPQVKVVNGPVSCWPVD